MVGDGAPGRFLARLPGGLLLFGLILAFLEIALGFLHLDRFDPEFTARSSFPVFLAGDGEFAGEYFTNPHFKPALPFQRFARRKGPGVFRVFVLGGSAARGWPGDERDAFSGYLRRALDNVVPGRFEVVNAAGMSYGSHRVLDLLKDVVRYEPDLVVIYSGNNEYVERNALPGPELQGGPLYAVRDALSRLNVYRALRLAIRRSPGLGALLDRPRGPDVTDLRANPYVQRGALLQTAENSERVTRNYAGNLSEMVRLLDRRGIRSIFCSVPVNLDGWPPSENPLRFGSTEEMAAWNAKVAEGKAVLGKDPAAAARIFGKLLGERPGWARGAYYRGQALEAQGEYAAALEMFRAARDGDPHPLRATGPFNAIVRSVAAGGRLARYLDLEGIFRENSPHGITGDLLVRDYCHPTEPGHKLVATVLLPLLLREAGTEAIRQAADAIASDATGSRKDPLAASGELYATGMARSAAGRAGEAEKIFLEVLRLNPRHAAAMNNLGILYMERGRLPEARAMFVRVLELDPGLLNAQFNLGFLQFREGDLAGAEVRMRAVLSANPEFPTARVVLGDIAQRNGAFREALAEYREALSLGYEDSHLHRMAGKAWLALGDKARARSEFAKAVEFDPSDGEALRLMQASR